MPHFAPGSFTKNSGWSKFPPGLNALHQAIHQGFSGRIEPVRREEFRSRCDNIFDRDRQLLHLNFFLHSSIIDGVDVVSVDELVRQAIYNSHNNNFDRLALFALHLSRQGERTRGQGDANGAAFANHYVQTCLWEQGGWRSERVNLEVIERSFSGTIVATEGSGTIHKCATNYIYILRILGLEDNQTEFINTHIDEWIGPALFLGSELINH